MARLVRNFTATAFCVIALSVATGATALASGETFQSPTTGQPGAPTHTRGTPVLGSGETFQSPTTGQPGAATKTCGTANPMTPGASATSPGSPFNAAGQAGVVYAGNPSTASLANSNSGATVSQYDAACVRLSSH